MSRQAREAVAISVHAPCELELMPERAVWWPERRAVFVSDLHLGKGATFRSAGACLPVDGDEEQLSRLSGLVERLAAERLIVLGDLVHAPAGVTAELLERVTRWRASLGIEVSLVPGNHDRHAPRLAEAWDINLLPTSERLGGLELVHDPEEASGDAFFLAGHVHPVVCFRGGGDALRLPCFVEYGPSAGSPGGIILPAFSRFTGGAAINRRSDGGAPRVLHAIADDRVEPV
ncbi:MAG: ligase-associated DNA damage response endonuclease PdeM [Planctomycetota bacterium]